MTIEAASQAADQARGWALAQAATRRGATSRSRSARPAMSVPSRQASAAARAAAAPVRVRAASAAAAAEAAEWAEPTLDLVKLAEEAVNG